MIFMLSLIPVVGFVISLIPLCIIGYNTGGLALTINILVMIAILHVIEGYFLNPKLMSSKNEPADVLHPSSTAVLRALYRGMGTDSRDSDLCLFFLDILDISRDNKPSLE
ncbi:AI-2E family transporter [Paenibacillus rhizoplanae]